MPQIQGKVMVGRIWLLSDPIDYRFAEASRRGTWQEKGGKLVRVSPLVIEWTKWTTASESVGDFLWPAIGENLVMHERIFQELQDRFGGIEKEPEPIRIIPPKHKRKKKKTTEDSSLTIWIDELKIIEARILHYVDIDWDKSCIKTTEEGGENIEIDVDSETFTVTTQRIPRVEGGGIYVKASLLQGHSFFKVNQFPIMNLCTDAVRDFILEKRYTNIDFLEVGELF